MIDVLTKPFKEFFKLESASGLILLFAATIALIISNSNFDDVYFDTLQKYISLGIGSFSLKLSVIHWINDVLMTVFFFLVSLEIKREIVQGELSNPKQALLPIIGAVGGMAVPAAIYIIININEYNRLMHSGVLGFLIKGVEFRNVGYRGFNLDLIGISLLLGM